MHPLHGARVFTYDGEPTLLAYHKLHTRYLALVYQQQRAWYGLVPFDTILDTVPIASVPLAVDLDLHATLEHTLQAWLTEVDQILHD